MLATIFAVFCLASALFALLQGGIQPLSAQIMQSAQEAVTLSLALLGPLCFWSGILHLFRQAGVTAWLSRLCAPLLSRLFPTAWKEKNGVEEICASFAGNLLGLGNAVTPFALSAMQKMQENNPQKERASEDMILFTVLSTVPFSLFPTTLLALRSAAGSASPSEILPLVWICSLCTACVATLLVKGFCRIWRR